MLTPAEVLKLSAADMNDSQQVNYTDAALLPYFNMAVEELLARMEENNIPITNANSSNITVPQGVTEVALVGTSPTLPAGLLEVEQMWESNDGGNTWLGMQKVETISPNRFVNTNFTFGCFEWGGDRIRVPLAGITLLIRLKYIKHIVTTPILLTDIANVLNINGKMFLAYKTASLCAMLINQDPERATILQSLAEESIEREMNIPTKGRQVMVTRRKPFRMNYKAGGRIW